ncbi:hypothetical protein PFUGPA_04530 [Plasmodium falciparum Palo Alto/Uganda]|uniref:Uncharacterized protein n=1 Tax=Plasmodium falciparum (isolate Palo Alto / Uganda) TaxID=57270 RepID=W4ITW6_PLAFP|nr:hypothetical protein PFUGPA_04530 [Plasmodium falciparum Palo Alto/Uganda]
MNDVNVINYSVNKLLYYNFMENFCNFIKMSSYKINKIVERRIIINLSLQWNSKLTKQLNEYF